MLDEVKHLGKLLGQSEAQFNDVRNEQQAWLMGIPNLALWMRFPSVKTKPTMLKFASGVNLHNSISSPVAMSNWGRAVD